MQILRPALVYPGSAGLRRQMFTSHDTRRYNMPYLLGWFLGVPVFVLVILYLIFH